MPKFRETPVTFTREEARVIRHAMGRSMARVDCPCCGSVLFISDPIDRGGSVGASYEVSCGPCHRFAVITEVPKIPKSEDEP